MRHTTPECIQTLAPNQIFVFGTNASGFHGSGAAGIAFRGDAGVGWRQDQSFLEALGSPHGSPLRVGRWAVLGVSRGFMCGRDGWSYGIETIRRPGQQRSTPLEEIGEQIAIMCSIAAERTDLEFLVTKIGCNLAGYFAHEIKSLFEVYHEFYGISDNVILPLAFEFRP